MKLLIIFGTRPEAIKMCPLINELFLYKNIDVKVCVTAQHREMLDQVLDIFNIEPDYDLNIMKKGQDLTQITSVVLNKMKDVMLSCKPDLVLVHGDTSTTFAASLAAYFQQIDVGHVEAGLRTGMIYSPWPEEINRKLTTCIAKYHFAPTQKSKSNLMKEGVSEDSIEITGNTVIDALMHTNKLINKNKPLENSLESSFDFCVGAK